MDRETELELVDELLALKKHKTHHLDAAVARSPVNHYVSEDRYATERDRIFRTSPIVAAHSSELEGDGAFLRREVAGVPLLLTRDKTGEVNAFLNVCRHRGTKLVDEETGCKHRFSCPYHAWTYSNQGNLIAAPHFSSGFEGLDKSELSLKRVQCQELYGFIWVVVSAERPVDVEAYMGELGRELEALKINEMVVAHQTASVHNANWKILVEGGIEAYHFKITHRTTIGPHFEDNLSTYRTFGPHMRAVLMRASMTRLDSEARDAWRLRDHAQVLYTLFPTASLLVQSDHISWIQSEPLAADRTSMRITTLVPKVEAERRDHWARNHEITCITLDEDFAIGESIQSTLTSGANDEMIFGRFEGALDHFNRTVESHLRTPDSKATAAA